MSYSIDPLSDGCYPGTSILINKLDIRDEALLDETEAFLTYINTAKLECEPIDGSFDFEHFKAIHRFLFSESYMSGQEIYARLI